MVDQPVETLARILPTEFKEEWEAYLERRRLALAEYAKVVKEADEWYKEIEQAVFAKSGGERKEHDEWQVGELRPIEEEWAATRNRLEQEFLRRKENAEREYQEAYVPIAQEYRAGTLPWEEAKAREAAINLRKMETVAEAEARKEGELKEPKERYEAAIDRLGQEYAKRVFPIDEWERLTLKAAKDIVKNVKEIAEARRDEVLQGPEIADFEAKALLQLGKVLERSLD